MQSTIKSRLLGALTILATVFTLQTALAAPQTLKMHSGIAQSRPEAAYLDQFAKLVEEKSNGDLKLEVYHSGSLGLKEADLLRTMQRGLIDMAMLYGEYYNRDAPELTAIYAQGAITRAEQHLEVLPTLRSLYENSFSKWGIRSVGGVVAPVFNVGLHCKEPINTLDGLKGKKVRVWSAQLVDTFAKLGISAQVIPQNDMYLALQTGVVDCAYYLSTVAKTVSLQEITKYEAYLHPWAAAPWIFGISERSWSRLSESQQRVLQEAGEDIWGGSRDKSVDPAREAAATAERQALGITVLEPFPQADVERFVAAAQLAWKELAERAGEAGLHNYKVVTQQLSH